MIDFIAETRGWRDAIAAAERDGFQIYEGDDSCFVLWLGNATRTVAYGPGVLQRAFDACVELLAIEAEQTSSLRSAGDPGGFFGARFIGGPAGSSSRSAYRRDAELKRRPCSGDWRGHGRALSPGLARVSRGQWS